MFSNPANTTGKVEDPFIYIVVISLVLLTLVTACMIFFVIRYRRSRHPRTEPVRESLLLEIVWTVIPTALAISMFYFGWVNFEYLRTPPQDALTVQVVARQWSWLFQYSDGKQSAVLRVPLNKPVRLSMTSVDVIHSLYIPAFRIKEDCVPGMKTSLWFTAKETGNYDIYCTEYCGVGHAHMLSKVIVMQAEEFEKWASAPEELSGLAAKGRQIATEKGCLGCHSIDGSRKVGPTFKGLLGAQETIVTNGQERVITVDEAFVENYIRHPNVAVIKGYPPVMPVIPVTDEELKAIIAYIKTVR